MTGTAKGRALVCALVVVLASAGILAGAPGVGATATSAPPAPTGLHATGVSASQIALTWNAVHGAQSYLVLRSLASIGPFTTVGSPTTATFADTGLSAGTKYYYEAKAVNATGPSPASLIAAALTIPAAPSGLTAKAVSTGQINLTWTAVTGAASYVVSRSTGGPFTAVGAPHPASFADTGLSAATTYFFVVQAKNGSGLSANSGETLAITAPVAPVGLSATVVSSSQVSLAWSPVTGATGYRVLHATVSGGPYKSVGTPTTTSFMDNGLSPATTYYYTVQATNASAASARSLQVSALTNPAPPTGIKATSPSLSEVDLSWNVVSGATGYVVQRSSTSGGPYTTLGSRTSPSFADIGLSPATTYYYVLQAIDASGPSVSSAQVSVITLPGAPSGVAATAVSPSEIDLSWSAVSGATGYVVQRSIGFGGPYTTVASPTSTSLADTGLAPGTTYDYVVQATDASGSSTSSATESVTTLVAVPTSVVATPVLPSEIDLSWKAVTGATGYMVQRATTSGGPYTIVSSPTSASFADTGLRPATTYFYVVQAIAGTVSSALSTEVSATTLLGVPSSPVATAVSVSGIDLVWSAVPGATAYAVQRSTTSGGPYTTVGSPTSASFADAGLAPATTYYYVIKATAGPVSSALSNEVSATTLLGAPTGVGATPVLASEIDLSWTAVTGATGYVVQRATISGGPYTQVGTPTSASFANTGLAPATTYYYVIRSTASSVSSGLSIEASALTLPAAPTSVVATAVARVEIDLTWHSVTGATGYLVRRSATTGGPYTTVGSTTTPSFADTSVNPATTYYYVVEAVDASGASAPSAQVSATTFGGGGGGTTPRAV